MCEPMVKHLYRSLGLPDPVVKEKNKPLSKADEIAHLGRQRLGAKVSKILNDLEKEGRMQSRKVPGRGRRIETMWSRTGA